MVKAKRSIELQEIIREKCPKLTEFTCQFNISRVYNGLYYTYDISEVVNGIVNLVED